MRQTQDLIALLPLLCFETLRRVCGNVLKARRLRGLNRGSNSKVVFKTPLRRCIQRILLWIQEACLNVSKFSGKV